MGRLPSIDITINTEQFEYSHGRKPRGYGNWCFSQSRRCDTIDYQITGFYRHAKVALQDYVRSEGFDRTGTWYVMP
jgi:hypothetical protein